MNEDAVAPNDGAPLDLMASIATPTADVMETPEVFLTGVAAALKASNEVDVDLATILSDHLLTVTPHDNVIANAKAAILTLAAKRAAAMEEQPDG